MSETGANPEQRQGPEVSEELSSAVESMLNAGRSQDQVRAAVQQALAQWHTKQEGTQSEGLSPEQPVQPQAAEEAQANPESA